AVGIDSDFLREATPTTKCEDRLTDLEVCHLGSDRNHFACHFAAGREWEYRLKLILVLNDQHIREVDPTSFHGNQNLSWPGNRIRSFSKNKLLGASKLCTKDCFHKRTKRYRNIEIKFVCFPNGARYEVQNSKSIILISFESAANKLEMGRDQLIRKTLEQLSKLPDQKIKEVSDFTEFLLHKIENQILTEGIQKMVSDSDTFHFLEEEEELYTEGDLKEKFK